MQETPGIEESNRVELCLNDLIKHVSEECLVYLYVMKIYVALTTTFEYEETQGIEENNRV